MREVGKLLVHSPEKHHTRATAPSYSAVFFAEKTINQGCMRLYHRHCRARSLHHISRQPLVRRSLAYHREGFFDSGIGQNLHASASARLVISSAIRSYHPAHNNRRFHIPPTE